MNMCENIEQFHVNEVSVLVKFIIVNVTLYYTK